MPKLISDDVNNKCCPLVPNAHLCCFLGHELGNKMIGRPTSEVLEEVTGNLWHVT